MDNKGQAQELERLRGMMDSELASERFYRALAAKLSRQQGQKLLQAAQDEARHLRALQMEYFLLTGDSRTPAAGEAVITSRLAALREGYHAERAAYDTYMQGAQDTASTALAAVFIANAADEARHAQMLRGMIGRALGQTE